MSAFFVAIISTSNNYDEYRVKDAELFIVEGKSASANLAKAINKTHQQVHALQGKLLNVRKHSNEAMLANVECQQLIDVLGCGISDSFDINALSFSSVVILMDPDIDGAHSGALLLSFFDLYYKPLVASGQLSLIKLPMFRVCSPAGQLDYAWSDKELQQILKPSSTVTRYKGVAQFSREECKQFMLNPALRRRLVSN